MQRKRKSSSYLAWGALLIVLCLLFGLYTFFEYLSFQLAQMADGFIIEWHEFIRRPTARTVQEEPPVQVLVSGVLAILSGVFGLGFMIEGIRGLISSRRNKQMACKTLE